MLRVLEKSLALSNAGVKPDIQAANTDSCTFLLWTRTSAPPLTQLQGWPFQKAVSLVHPPPLKLHSK